MICSICKIDKNSELFRKYSKSKSGCFYWCKDCEKKKGHEYYIQNKEVISKRSKESNKRIRRKIRDYIIEYLKCHPCVDCGESDIVVLEFDHFKDKVGNMTEMIRNTSFQRIKQEIQKCDIRCANCHRRKTAKEQGWYKLEK